MMRFLLSVILALTFTLTAVAAPTDQVSVTVCHATKSSSNPYTKNTVAVHSVDDANGLNGHGDHASDIWAPFIFDGVQYPGRGNWSLLDSDCNEVPISTPTAILPTPTATPTDDPTIEPTATLPDPTATPTDVKPTPDTTPVDTTATPTATEEPTGEPTPTSTEPTPTSTPTDEPTPTETDEPTEEPTPTDAPTEAPTPAPTPTSFIPVAGFVEGQSMENNSEKLSELESLSQLEIPSIGFLETVGSVPRYGNTWALGKAPSLLEGLSAIGVHNGYADTEWHRLAELQAGVSLIWDGNSYVVRDVITVDPMRIEALRLGDLAIFTCISFDGSEWQERLVIISERVVIL